MIRVLHTNAGRNWSGIEKRIFTIAHHLNSVGIKNSFAINEDSPLAVEAKRVNIECFPFSIRNKCDVGAIFQLKKILKKGDFNIIHTHRSTDHWIAVETVKFFKSPCRLIRTRHSHIPVNRNWINNLLYKKFTDKIVTVAEVSRQQLIEYNGIDASKIATVHSSVFLDQFHPDKKITGIRDELGLDKNTSIIGTVGKISLHKNYPLLLHAFKIVKRSIQNVKLIIVGKGPLENKMKLLSRELDVEEDTYFLGERKDIPQIMATLDVFVLASMVEGSPASLKEAMVSGKPVVATAVGGIPEIIEDGVSGILVPLGESARLASKIIRILKSQELAEKLGRGAQEVILKKFTPSVMISKMREVYLEVAEMSH
ncbi:MAG TPA: glycosyltransferase family 1 protein [Candidatus Omnitrophica bacterium]|nr:glycosyltransferase family 1 protein [Candidatus Omnitrophota bacterium]